MRSQDREDVEGYSKRNDIATVERSRRLGPSSSVSDGQWVFTHVLNEEIQQY